MTEYYDYRFKTSDLAGALAAVEALRTLAILGYNDGPDNMLGDVINDAEGNPVLRARRGSAAYTVTGPDADTVTVPARGDRGLWYLAIRTRIAPSDIPFDPATYGLRACDADESASVLGAWA